MEVDFNDIILLFWVNVLQFRQRLYCSLQILHSPTACPEVHHRLAYHNIEIGNNSHCHSIYTVWFRSVFRWWHRKVHRIYTLDEFHLSAYDGRVRQLFKATFNIVAGSAVFRIKVADRRHKSGNAFQTYFPRCFGSLLQFPKMLPYLLQG